MKYIVLILFSVFVLQNDTTKVDTVKVQQSIVIQKDLDNINNNLDSIIAILKKDTLRNKKQ